MVHLRAINADLMDLAAGQRGTGQPPMLLEGGEVMLKSESDYIEAMTISMERSAPYVGRLTTNMLSAEDLSGEEVGIVRGELRKYYELAAQLAVVVSDSAMLRCFFGDHSVKAIRRKVHAVLDRTGNPSGRLPAPCSVAADAAGMVDAFLEAIPIDVLVGSSVAHSKLTALKTIVKGLHNRGLAQYHTASRYVWLQPDAAVADILHHLLRVVLDEVIDTEMWTQSIYSLPPDRHETLEYLRGASGMHGDCIVVSVRADRPSPTDCLRRNGVAPLTGERGNGADAQTSHHISDTEKRISDTLARHDRIASRGAAAHLQRQATTSKLLGLRKSAALLGAMVDQSGGGALGNKLEAPEIRHRPNPASCLAEIHYIAEHHNIQLPKLDADDVISKEGLLKLADLRDDMQRKLRAKLDNEPHPPTMPGDCFWLRKELLEREGGYFCSHRPVHASRQELEQYYALPRALHPTMALEWMKLLRGRGGLRRALEEHEEETDDAVASPTVASKATSESQDDKKRKAASCGSTRLKVEAGWTSQHRNYREGGNCVYVLVGDGRTSLRTFAHVVFDFTPQASLMDVGCKRLSPDPRRGSEWGLFLPSR